MEGERAAAREREHVAGLQEVKFGMPHGQKERRAPAAFKPVRFVRAESRGQPHVDEAAFGCVDGELQEGRRGRRVSEELRLKPLRARKDLVVDHGRVRPARRLRARGVELFGKLVDFDRLHPFGGQEIERGAQRHFVAAVERGVLDDRDACARQGEDA